MSLILIGMKGEPTELHVFLITAQLVGCIGLLLQVVIIDRATLQLSPGGLRLRQTGYTLSTAWSNVVDLRLQPGREGFITSEPINGRGPAVLASFRGVALPPGLPMYDAEQQQLLAERRLIPVEAFAWHLHRRQFREDIACFAPHLAHLLTSERGAGFKGGG